MLGSNVITLARMTTARGQIASSVNQSRGKNRPPGDWVSRRSAVEIIIGSYLWQRILGRKDWLRRSQGITCELEKRAGARPMGGTRPPQVAAHERFGPRQFVKDGRAAFLPSARRIAMATPKVHEWSRPFRLWRTAYCLRGIRSGLRLMGLRDSERHIGRGPRRADMPAPWRRASPAYNAEAYKFRSGL
jgi:hypothetical protein